MLGRPIEFDTDEVLESAMQLFWRQGYEATSLQDLIVAMGLSKSSFYQTFKSKHQLFQRCLQHYRRTLTAELRERLSRADSAKMFISDVLNNVSSETSGPDARRGCMLMNTASEFSQRDASIADIVSHSVDSFTDVFEVAILQAQQQGEIQASRDARSLATYLVSTISGLRNMVKAGADSRTIKQIVEVALPALG